MGVRILSYGHVSCWLGRYPESAVSVWPQKIVISRVHAIGSSREQNSWSQTCTGDRASICAKFARKLHITLGICQFWCPIQHSVKYRPLTGEPAKRWHVFAPSKSFFNNISHSVAPRVKLHESKIVPCKISYEMIYPRVSLDLTDRLQIYWK